MKCFGESSLRDVSTFGVSKVDRNFVWVGGGNVDRILGGRSSMFKTEIKIH